MSKNMTRKGLALGVGAVLVASTFGVAPANANGLADKTFVSLTPKTGTEYTVLAAANRTFTLTSNEAASVTTGNLKFLVSDQDGVIEPTAATTGRTFDLADAATLGATTDELVTITDATLAAAVAVGDRLHFTEALTADNDANDADFEVTVAAAGSIVTITDVTGNNVQFTTPTTVAAAVTGAGNGGTTNGITVEVVREARSALTRTFVVDTGSNTAASDSDLVLAVDGSNTRSVTVTAWKDANGNDLIDSTEYASPARTVTWIKPSDLVTSVSMAPVAGDTKLTAIVRTTPVLNGEQVLTGNSDWLNVAFTRQDDATVMYANDEDSGDLVPVSAWDDDNKTWTVSVQMDADASTVGSSNLNGNVDAGWALTGAAGGTITSPTHSGGVLTATVTNHNLRVGDRILLNAGITSDVAATQTLLRDGVAKTIASVPNANTFTIAVPGASTIGGTLTYDIRTWPGGGSDSLVDRVFPGNYTARAFVEGVASGSTLSVGTIATATVSASMTSTGSASVTGRTVTTNNANDVIVKTGTASVSFTVNALGTDGVALGAGRTVVVSTAAPTDGGAASGTFRINGGASATLLTDASGQVSFTLTATDTRATAQTRVSVLVENLVTVGMDVHWDDQVYSLVDFGTTAGTIAADAAIARTTTSGGSYNLDFAVADQWFQAAPAASFRLVVSGSGVTERIVNLVDGRATVAVKDAGITAVGGNFTSSIVLQRLTGTTWGAVSSHTLTTTIAAAPSVRLGTDGSSVFQPTGSTAVVDLADAVAARALVEIDKRSSTAATPAYANDVIIQGLVANSSTSAAVANSYVTISGPSNILFSNGEKAARGSLTFLSDSNGEFEVYLYSTTAQTDTVITVASMGGTATTRVTFTGIGVGEGTKLDVTTPASVRPASTFQVKAKLSDAFGNGVDTGANSIRVTYTGPGIVFGTLPNETDRNGELSFSVLLGSNDTGNVVVTVSYDQNGDGDYVDAKDLNTTKTTVVGSGAAAGTGKVNVGSFNGRLVVYAANLNGKRISWKVNGRWGSAVADSNFDSFNRPTSRAGVTVNVEVFVDGVSTLTKSVVTR